MKNPGSYRQEMGRALGLATQLGLSMGLVAAGLVLGGLFAGRWLDRQMGSSPLATLVLAVAGGIAGQIAAYRLARRAVAQWEPALVSAPDAAAETGDERRVAEGLGLAVRVLGLLTIPSLAGAAIGLTVDARLGTGIATTLILVLGGLILGLLGAWRLSTRHLRGASPGADAEQTPTEKA